MPACPPIVTGDDFLERTLMHLDCQAQVIGSYGYIALGQPGATASTLVSGLLAIFVAMFGIRLLFGPPPGARNLVFNVLKIGIVLTLAFSWPAFRTVIYDAALNGPGEVASVIQSSSGNSRPQGFRDRLQQVDNDLVRLTVLGTGRGTGQFIGGNRPGATFAGTALNDEDALGSARVLYLASVMGSLALLRIAAGLLLALTPIVAGLSLFTQSRGIFAGWLKGLLLTMAGSIGVTLVLTVQLAMVEPWLADALQARSLGYAIPSAPTEIFAIMLGFAIVQLVMIWFLARAVFHRGWLTLPNYSSLRRLVSPARTPLRSPETRTETQIRNSERISNAVEKSVAREQVSRNAGITERFGDRSERTEIPTPASDDPRRLGSTSRRTAYRISRIGQIRERTRK